MERVQLPHVSPSRQEAGGPPGHHGRRHKQRGVEAVSGESVYINYVLR